MNFARLIETIFIPGFNRSLVHIDSKNFSLPQIQSVGLYLHIPFCHSLCPYCPYDRIFYEKKLAYEYVESVKKEISHVASVVGKIDVSSLYIGGGTPTTIAEKLPEIVRTFKDSFNFKGGIFIETSPYDITDEKMRMLKDTGISMISIGVQSFQNKYLKLIGRNYDEESAYESIRIVQKYFNNINIDLMFALPYQSEEDFYFDLKEAVKTGVNQITAYPLFTFPYSGAGEFLKVKKVKLPKFFVRKKMFELMHNYLTKEGFNPVSVWGFKKGKLSEFSSVTRSVYLGFGASAGTKIRNAFYMNTFSVRHYIEKVSKGEFAEVVKMDYTNLMDDYYWLYWKLYETKIPIVEFKRRFSTGKKKKARVLIFLLIILGMARKKEKYYTLTKRGMFYVHLMQNYFSMNYINTIWSVMLRSPEPKEILL